MAACGETVQEDTAHMGRSLNSSVGPLTVPHSDLTQASLPLGGESCEFSSRGSWNPRFWKMGSLGDHGGLF